MLASTAQTVTGGAEGAKASFARTRTFTTQAEAAINEQINVEWVGWGCGRACRSRRRRATPVLMRPLCLSTVPAARRYNVSYVYHALSGAPPLGAAAARAEALHPKLALGSAAARWPTLAPPALPCPNPQPTLIATP